jgi:hypothetical protein
MDVYRAAGFIDDEGDLAFIPGVPNEPVRDMFARATHAGEWVVFVTLRDSRLEFQPMRRGASVTPGSAVTRMTFGTTVAEWFDAVEHAPTGSTWHADDVPDEIPAWVVESDHVQRLEVATNSH